MEAKQVNVLISTYNGAKYIQEQIDSILKQTYSNIKIYVRDDGSSDETLAILKKNQEELGRERFVVIAGGNLGFGKSFMQILEIAEDGDYWAFCDQDDVWLEHKIADAVKWLEANQSQEPRMYHSAFQNTDEQLNPQEAYLPPAYEYNFIRSITDCLHMGFSEVINAGLRDMMLQGDQSVLTTHDHWAELLVMEFGEVYFDEKIGSYHRRLDSSISGGGMKNRIKWLKGALKGDSDILPSARECYRLFGDKMQEKDYKVLSWFVYDRYSLKKAVCKACYPKRWRPSLSSELVMRFLMIIGKI